MKLLIDNITLKPDQPESLLKTKVTQKYKVSEDTALIIDRKSLDARDASRIIYRYRLIIDVPDKTGRILLKRKEISLFELKPEKEKKDITRKLKVLIVGSGPGGLFCALRLADAGVDVEIFERGKQVDQRIDDIKILEREGILDSESNVLFGEGGAGTYSDGKLTTRINRPEVKEIFDTLVQMGAPHSILYDAKPHLGSDKIRVIVENIRKMLEDRGATIHFGKKVTDLIIKDNKILGLITDSDEEFSGAPLVLATGHSARDIYGNLFDCGVAMEKKGFAIGVRIEHPLDLINELQYGTSPYKNILPAADYRLVYNNRSTARGIYSFCMCPGGMIINSSSEPGMLCTNGMSYSKRNNGFSNAAIVVSVQPDDIDGTPLDAIEFQRSLERGAYTHGDDNFIAPGQRITSFIQKKLDISLPAVSYRPGVVPGNIHDYLPSWISENILEGIRHFDKRMPGFITEEGTCIGIETRTSSPIRIVRNENFESVSHPGLFLVGEGAGYAGGIISSAVDGFRAADSIIEQYSS